MTLPRLVQHRPAIIQQQLRITLDPSQRRPQIMRHRVHQRFQVHVQFHQVRGSLRDAPFQGFQVLGALLQQVADLVLSPARPHCNFQRAHQCPGAEGPFEDRDIRSGGENLAVLWSFVVLAALAGDQCNRQVRPGSLLLEHLVQHLNRRHFQRLLRDQQRRAPSKQPLSQLGNVATGFSMQAGFPQKSNAQRRILAGWRQH